MRFLDSHWERVRLVFTPANLRIGLFVVSIVAMVLGGAADESWE